MKIPICLLIVSGAVSVFADGAAPAGSTGASKTQSASQQAAAARTALGQGATGSVSATAPNATTGGQTLNAVPGGETPAVNPPVSTTPGLNTPATVTGIQQGIRPPDTGITPLTNAPGGVMTNLLPQNVARDQEIVDPAGANAAQGSLGTTSGTSGQQSTPSFFQRADQTQFGNQFRLSTGQNGSTQLSFPNENATVTVIANDGTLTLQGNTTTAEQRATIEEAIRNISGGTFIDNQIQVTSPDTATQSTGTNTSP